MRIDEAAALVDRLLRDNEGRSRFEVELELKDSSFLVSRALSAKGWSVTKKDGSKILVVSKDT